MMNINHEQAKALARYLHTIRNDWHIDGILTALGKARDQAPIETVTLWATKAALEPSNRTPAVIAMPGPHREAPKPEPRSYNIPCSTHPDQTLPCRRCTHERVPADNANAAQLARQALAKARAALCPHGVKRGPVKCGHCERPAPKPEPHDTTDTNKEPAAAAEQEQQ